VTRGILNLVYYYLGWIDTATVISRMVDFLIAVINALSAWWNSLSFWDKVIIGLAVGTAILGAVLSAGAVAVAKAAAFVSSMIVYGYMMYLDWSDSDSEVG